MAYFIAHTFEAFLFMCLIFIHLKMHTKKAVIPVRLMIILK